ncbi:ADP-ribosylglycohydrolase family protein [Ferrimonas balearica]|uniref:ADP-ribosylglycohydrolase family protein n=1 Tax=Ferrimonas balearica TaxID=44012 RepID=UPI001C99A74E|nr:ADP-ribosylglycohydrolase family protein [Ferrimonas balearica]MBY5990505.1 ADP-ribosylglycohydrolase family protein [Ferrimonas balearica]
MNQLHDKAQGALLGLALGDALGTTLEFQPKDSYPPLTDLVGGGPFNLAPGQWTDDTAMALCLAQSLVETGRNDIVDQMQRYLRWFREGENACTGECIDIGHTVKQALLRFEADGNPVAGIDAEWTAGNGSLMRIAPIALFFHRADLGLAISGALISSITTHGEQRAIEACELMTYFLHRLLNSRGQPCKAALLFELDERLDKVRQNWHPAIQAIANGAYRHKPRSAIHGSGYVVHSLEAALWSFFHSNSFAEGALLAANLGEDADTTAAIYGQLAGAYYGRAALPQAWLEKLAWRDSISALARMLCDLAQTAHGRGPGGLAKGSVADHALAG